MNHITDFDFEAMRNMDIRTVDPKTLVDIQNIKIDVGLPETERIIDYINQIKNPYCFRCGKIIVKLSYADNDATMEQRMEGFFRAL